MTETQQPITPALPDVPDPGVTDTAAAQATRRRVASRISLKGRGLRQHAARGVMINAGFDVGLACLGLARGFIIAAFLTRADYGIWGIVMVGLGTLLWLKDVGIGDKYTQQDESDQELAFQKAFTLEAMLTAISVVFLWAAVPVFALVYGRSDLLAPGFAFTMLLPAYILQSPAWIFGRRMDFVRQRSLQAVDFVIGFVATVGMAIAGFGYWSIILGALIGSYSGAIVALMASPYPLRFRYDRGTLREYVSFSWPLFLAGASSLVIAQGSILFGNMAVGVAGVGAIALAASISQWSQRVDAVVSSTLYPAVCAVRDRVDLLFESFVKSNRLALMWGMPFGAGLALFAPDLVHFGLGNRWVPAIVLLQAFGISAALDQIGFNWNAYFRAIARTRPIAVANASTMVAFLVAPTPLVFLFGLKGFAGGILVMTVTGLVARTYYLTQLFPGFQMAKHAARAIAPTIPAVAAVLFLRLFEHGERTRALAVGELALYLVVTLAATVLFERRLLLEAAGYLRRRRSSVPAAT